MLLKIYLKDLETIIFFFTINKNDTHFQEIFLKLIFN